METSIRVFLVHSNEVIREGIRHILHSHQGIEIVGDALNVERALAQVAHLAPDVLVIEPNTAASTRVEVVGEVTVVGRHGEYRVQVIDVGPGSLRGTETIREELANAIVLAAREDLTLGMTSGPTSQILTPANGREAVAAATNVHATNGHQNGSVNGKIVTEGVLPRTNGHANGTGNGNVVTEGARVENTMRGWFRAVTIREGGPLDGTADEEGPPPARDPLRDLPEGTKVTDDPAIHWETPQQKVQQEADEPWMNLWVPPAHRDAAEKVPPAEVELIFPSYVGPKDLYDFVLQLQRATRADVKETSGSFTGQTSVKMMVDRSVPLLEIMRMMPEVAEVNAEITQAYGWGPLASSPYLPQKISVDLKRAEEEAKPEEEPIFWN